jgi:hypothetical protein
VHHSPPVSLPERGRIAFGDKALCPGDIPLSPGLFYCRWVFCQDYPLTASTHVRLILYPALQPGDLHRHPVHLSFPRFFVFQQVAFMPPVFPDVAQ